MKDKRFRLKKTVIIALTINVIQLGALAMLLLYSFFSSEPFYIALGINSKIFLILIILTSLINGFFSIRDIYHLVRTNLQYNMLKETLQAVENLNNSLREQRHDFLNHLQVVYGLIEIDEFKEAKDYITKVYKDIQSVSRVLKTANPAVNALLQAKLMTAEKNNVHMETLVASSFENLPVPSWELCRILGNLIDNAISSLNDKTTNRVLHLALKEELKSFVIIVKDNGPGIPENILDKIFEPGFTTKRNIGEGMGLAITRKILQKYYGQIEVKSDTAWTVFTVIIPKSIS